MSQAPREPENGAAAQPDSSAAAQSDSSAAAQPQESGAARAESSAEPESTVVVQPEAGAAAALGPIQLVPDQLIGRSVGGFVIEEPLGEGGMGVVYLARHPILNRRFAVKVLKPEAAADPWLTKSFLREAQTLSALKHPHIVDIVDFGPLDDDRQYMVMEFLEGHTLAQELQACGRLPTLRALQLADQILDGLWAAHSVDVIHRDLKPSNVLLAKVSGGNEVAKLLDFGLSKQTPSTIRESELQVTDGRSAMAGTPEYIAPEQARAQPACKQSDLYSFGVMLYEMLTGHLPFERRENGKDQTVWLLSQHAHAPAPKLTPIPGEAPFPQALRELVASLLDKYPKRRPASALWVRESVRQILRELGRPGVDAPPLTPRPQGGSGPRSELLDLELEPPQIRRLRPWLVGATALGLMAMGAVALTPEPPALAATPQHPPAATSPAAVGPAAPPEAAKSKLAQPEVPSPPPLPVIFVPGAPQAGEDGEVVPLSPSPKSARAARRGGGPAASACEPSEKWRASAQARLQEIQQTAAASSDGKAWQAFERAEPALSGAITAASSGAQCEAVEKNIRALARRIRP